MADLTRTYRWERFIPNLGDNRDQPRPFYLELASGLTKEQLAVFAEGFQKMDTKEGLDGLSAHYAPFVRMGEEPLVFAGKAYPTLRDYFELLFSMAGGFNSLELTHTLADFNSAAGTRRLFFERLSGGSPGTGNPNSAPSATRRAAPSSGKPTNATVFLDGTPRPAKEPSPNPDISAP